MTTVTQTQAMKLALEYLEQRELAWNVQIALREALALAQPQQEPVECANGCRGFFKHHPPARKPLTDEEIAAIDDEIMKSPRGYCMKFARAIEAAHGIK